MYSLQPLKEKLNQAFQEEHVATYGTGDHTLTRELTVIHEAGHAAIYRLMGISPFIKTSQDSDGYWIGYCGFGHGYMKFQGDVFAIIATDIITSMSGYSAEKELTDEYCPSSSGVDKANAKSAAYLLGELTSIDPELILEVCQSVTDNFINEHADSIKVLANRLMKAKCLDAQAVEKILNIKQRYSGLDALGKYVLEDKIGSVNRTYYDCHKKS